MSLETLSLDTMSQVDYGKIDAALKSHLKRATLDCMDRPETRTLAR